jgi:hypothetical protein
MWFQMFKKKGKVPFSLENLATRIAFVAVSSLVELGICHQKMTGRIDSILIIRQCRPLTF